MNNKDVMFVAEDTASLIMVPVKAVTADLVTEAGVTVYVPLATTKNPGIVQIGDGLKITDKGILSVDSVGLSASFIVKNDDIVIYDNTKSVDFSNAFKVSHKDDTDEVLVDVDDTLKYLIENYHDDYAFLVNSFDNYYDKTYIDDLIINDLETNYSNKALSAAQGVVLKDMILEIPHAKVFDTISDMVFAFNAAGADAYRMGSTIRIVDTQVPDFWISGVYDDYKSYDYVDDDTLIASINEYKRVRVGYYDLSKAEVEKVVLDDYVKKTDYATNNGGHGIVKISSPFGIGLPNGPTQPIAVIKATDADVTGKTNIYRPLTSSNIDLVVKVGMTTNKLEWSEEEKTNARQLLGIEDLFVTTNTQQEITGTKVFTDNIYIKNSEDGTLDRIAHLGNQFTIFSQNGTENRAIFHIDKQLGTVSAYDGKDLSELAFKSDITEAGGTKVYYDGNETPIEKITFASDPQQQIDVLAEDSKTNLKHKNLGGCVLEAPNGVMSCTNGIVTTHKGLKVLIPAGLDENGQHVNTELMLEDDVVYDVSFITDNNPRTLFLNEDGDMGYGMYVYGPYTTSPRIRQEHHERYYDSTKNKCYYHDSTMTNWEETKNFIVLGVIQRCDGAWVLTNIQNPAELITRYEADKYKKVDKHICPNLLCNSDFRLKSSGLASSATTGVELVDGWYVRERSIRVGFNQQYYNPGGITIMLGNTGEFGGFAQRIRDYKRLFGKTVTLSVKIKSIQKNANDRVGVGLGAQETTWYYGTDYGRGLYTDVKAGDILTSIIKMPEATTEIINVPLNFWILAYATSQQPMYVEIEWAKLEINNAFTGYEYDSASEASQIYQQNQPNIRYSRTITYTVADGAWTGIGPMTHTQTMTLNDNEFFMGVTYGQKSNGAYNNGECWRITGCKHMISAINTAEKTYTVQVTVTAHRTANDGTNAGTLVYYIGKTV